jgi:hypothetical protein
MFLGADSSQFFALSEGGVVILIGSLDHTSKGFAFPSTGDGG